MPFAGDGAAQFQNAVEKTQWRCAGFSADGEYVVAAVAAGSREGPPPHKVYVWNRATGKLIHILEGAPPAQGAGRAASRAKGAGTVCSGRRAAPRRQPAAAAAERAPSLGAGPREAADVVADVVWHPASSTFVALAEGGLLYLWAPVYAENWSAFAPDFKARARTRPAAGARRGGQAAPIQLSATAHHTAFQHLPSILPPSPSLTQARTHPHTPGAA